VIVYDFNVMGATIAPNETDPPLIVNPYAVLAFSVSGEGFQSVSRRNAEIVNIDATVQHPQFPQGGLLNSRRQPSRILAMKDRLRFPTPETFNHGFRV
jgi:hypothetical protein